VTLGHLGQKLRGVLEPNDHQYRRILVRIWYSRK
jgi:hypothetical protein